MDEQIISNVQSMQLKDGTIIVVNQEQTAGNEEQPITANYYQTAGNEEQPIIANNYQTTEIGEQPIIANNYQTTEIGEQPIIANNYQTTEIGEQPQEGKNVEESVIGIAEIGEQDPSNQLRARPMIGRLGPVLAPPIPMVRPVVAPLRPPLKPMIAPRGPVRRGYPVYPAPVLRGRGNPYLTPKPIIPPKPKMYPLGYVPPIGKPKMVVTPPVVGPRMVPPVAKPGMMVPQPVAKPLLNQIIQAPHVMPRTTVFRARPGQADENDFQEEEYNGEEYCECDEQAQDENGEVELRARPLGVPVYRPVPVVPKVMPRHVVPIAPRLPKRGPIPRVPLAGYNTFQPRVFRARPRGVIVPTPMFTPLSVTFQPKSYGFGRPLSHHPGKRGYIPPPMRVFRARPRSTSYDGQDYDNQNYEEQNQCNTEGNECGTSICTRCGKEF